MPNLVILTRRFQELSAQLAEVEATKKYVQAEYFPGDRIDDFKFDNWIVKARNLIVMACTRDSEHYKQFLEAEKPGMYKTNYDTLVKVKAVFLAAKEDYEGGYLSSVQSLVQAELFSDELDQAKELLSSGYRSAATVVAGVVLETTIRSMCVSEAIPLGKLDKMNSDLAKAGKYNLLVQKRVTALADIRNNAAHGHPEQFKDADVSEMISYVERFVSDYV